MSSQADKISMARAWMKISFLNNSSIAFDPRTPLSRPLGGTESAVAYLSAALARAGVQVVLFNHSAEESVVDGIHVVPVKAASSELLADCDLLVVVSSAIGSRIRTAVRDRVPILLWGHHDINQPAISRLAEPQERSSWDGHVMVSNWQAQRFVAQFSLPQNDVHVIGNGVSPAVLAQPVGPAWYETGNSPTLVYSSTPFRGLDVLLQCFPAIRARVPDVRLRIHSSMNIYGMGLEADAYTYLYDLAKSLRGVDYVGPVSQSELAKSLSSVAALAYPSTFMETSCIAVMESMASGAEVFTTRFGALPETLNGFGRTLPMESDGAIPTGANLANGYVKLVCEGLREAKANPSAAADRRRQCVEFARRNYNWDARAQQWIALAQRYSSGKADAPMRPAVPSLADYTF